MDPRIEKPWGWSQELYRDHQTRVVKIWVKPGGYCSIHHHNAQDNHFLVLSGVLEVAIDPWAETPRREVMVAGSHVMIPAGWKHQFRVPTGQPVEALEIYRGRDDEPPRELDIVRFSEGGVA